MSHVLKNSDTKHVAWQPNATLDHLRIRANVLARIRDFFKARNILEVDTPLLCHTSVTDPYIDSLSAYYQKAPHEPLHTYYLQTSPEYAMKRLLAAGYGSIYQICKAFRQGETGRMHNPEFTMLEWYRIDFDHHQLMDEMDDLLQHVLNTKKAERLSYAEMFQRYLFIDPHHATVDELKTLAYAKGMQVATDAFDRDTWLQLLMTHYIEAQLGQEAPCFIYDFPATQAALARIEEKNNTQVAHRFEVYVKGVELANGFHELKNAEEQRERFVQQLEKRKTLSLPLMPIDEKFLAALSHGLPDCAGVALGIDRLIMLLIKATELSHVLSFDFSRV